MCIKSAYVCEQCAHVYRCVCALSMCTLNHHMDDFKHPFHIFFLESEWGYRQTRSKPSIANPVYIFLGGFLTFSVFLFCSLYSSKQ